MISKIKLLLSDTDLNEIISKASFFLVFRALAFIFAYVFAILSIKFYGVKTYGFVTLSFTILMITSVFCRFGLDVSLTKVFSRDNDKDKFSHYFFSLLFALIISLTVAFNIYLFSSEISLYVFSKLDFEIYLKWTAVSVPIWTILLINIGVFRGLGKAKYYSTLDNFGRFLLSIVVLVIFILIGSKDADEPIKAHFIGLLILLIVSLHWVYKSINKRGKKNLFQSKRFIKSSFPIMLSTSIVIFLSWFDKILLGIYNTEENIAVYDIAIRIATLITFNLEAINSILSSKISRFYNEGKTIELNKIIQFSAKINTILALAMFLILIIFSETILSLFGNEFIIGFEALLILSFGQMFNSFCGPVGNILHMTGNQKEFRNIMIVTLVINIILNLLLIPRIGINGAAISTTISLIIWNFLGVILVKKKLNINSFYWPWKT